jgi:hypothetical protein
LGFDLSPTRKEEKGEKIEIKSKTLKKKLKEKLEKKKK